MLLKFYFDFPTNRTVEPIFATTDTMKQQLIKMQRWCKQH